MTTNLFRRSLVLLTVAALPVVAFAGPSLNEAPHIETLKGIDAVHLWIAGIDSDAASISLSDARIRAAVEPTLNALGIRTLSRQQAMARPDVPVFTVYVNASRNVVDTSYSFTLEYRQIVYTESKQRVHVPTWSIGRQGMERNEMAATQITSFIREGMDRFALDLRRAKGAR